jgi:hypothetical protein
MAPWIYDEKFLTDIQFLFGTLPFVVGEGDDHEHPTQEQEERRIATIGFEFTRGLKNSATTFQAAVRQSATINLIESPTRPLIVTPLTTTQSFGLALGEIRTTKHEESTWSGVAIRKRSIPPTSTQRSTSLQRQNAAPLHQVALHLNPNFSTVRQQGRTCRTDLGSHYRTGAR